MKSPLAKFTLAALIGAALTNLWPPLDARAEDSSTCVRCGIDNASCVTAATGTTQCIWINGKCTQGGSPCGISGG